MFNKIKRGGGVVSKGVEGQWNTRERNIKDWIKSRSGDSIDAQVYSANHVRKCILISH
jgi:hypothetical protein